MTLLERQCYLDPPAALNLTWGYPEGLTPEWMRDYQLHPARKFRGPCPERAQEWLPSLCPDFPAAAPAPLAEVVCGYFRDLLGCRDVRLADSCSRAFDTAARALIRAPGDEFVLTDFSYDSYPVILRSLGARVVFARRTPEGLPDPEAIGAACTERTRAVVVVSPDNPSGAVCPREALERLMALCGPRGITLLADHSMAELRPGRGRVPLLPRVAAGSGCSWMALGDTGKILGLGDSKFGAVAHSPGWQEALEAAASPFGFRHRQFDLYLLASVLSDPRLTPYLHHLRATVCGNHERLRRLVRPPLAVPGAGGGCFALVDAAGLGTDDMRFAALLRRHGVLTVPASAFPSGRARAETRVRIALARPPEVIEEAAAVLGYAAARSPAP